MKKSRFSESQIVAILKEVELGAKVGKPPPPNAKLRASVQHIWPVHWLELWSNISDQAPRRSNNALIA